ncbi:VOC family protein [Glycomyces endophyticus]|uniref:VOC family protein n=1 Tax=Glycomyces endophyticus TaxID=480996 RepID=A0ABN2HXI0_9ACTN
MALKRMDHVGIVVEDLPAAIAFFLELGMELEGETTVQGPEVDLLIGLEGVVSDVAFVKSPDGAGRVELSVFHSPDDGGPAPRPALHVPGIPRLTFVVDSVDDTAARLRAHGAEPLGGTARFGDQYRYLNVRGPAGVIIGLVEETG